MQAIDAMTGSVQWNSSAGERNFYGLINNNVLYVTGSNGLVYGYSLTNGNLVYTSSAYDAANGPYIVIGP